MKSRKDRGITLIALIVTIIVLIILAGVAINMLSGQNGVINRATEARYSNTIAGFDERTKLAYIAVRSKIEADKVSKPGYKATTVSQGSEKGTFEEIVEEVAKEFNVTAIKGGEGTKIDTEGYTVTYYLDTPVAKNDTTTDGYGYIIIWYTDNSLRSSLNREEAITKNGLKDIASNKSVNQAVLARVIYVENYGCELASESGLTSTTDANKDITEDIFKQTSLNDNLGFTSTAVIKYDRTEINVGDFISYTPPTREAYTGFTKNATGDYSANQTLPQEYTGAKWRVMKKYDDGSLDIVAAVTSSNKTIKFQSAEGYNNAVFLLDDACKTLYANGEKGITARSIDYEDITRELVTNVDGKGQKKIDSYINSQVENLTVNSGNVIAKNGNIITYQTNTFYPLLYKKQANESDPYYTSATTERRIATKPESLEVEYTYVYEYMSKDDFKDYTDNVSNFYKAVFQTGTDFWLASRCVECNQSYVFYGVRNINGTALYYGTSLDNSGGGSYSNTHRVCPVVHLGNNVKVKVGSNPSQATGAHTVVVQ